MIEKLDKHLASNINSCNMSQNIMVAHKAIEKINELVDAVNELQKQIEKVSFAILDLATPNGENKALESIQVAPADPYAEQKKWIGCVCRFWDDNSKITKHFGILTRIDETAIVRYEAEDGFWYCACEPVKPDDDIIYKGKDNEYEKIVKTV